MAHKNVLTDSRAVRPSNRAVAQARAWLGGWSGRSRLLLRERHPVLRHFVLACLIILAAVATQAGFERTAFDVFSPAGAAGVISVFGLFLLFRLSDELKDEANDRRLFPDRPLPSGRVLRLDILFMMGLVIALLALLNSARPTALLAFLMVISYVALLHVYLFVPRVLMARPLLNLAVHNPIFAAILGYAFVAASVLTDPPASTSAPSPVSLFVLCLWLPFFAWELLRKVSVGVSQPDYDVYAPALGRSGSLLLATAAQALAFVLFLVLASRIALPSVSSLIAMCGLLSTVLATATFVAAPASMARGLRIGAEAFLVSLPAALALGLVPLW